MMLPTQKSASIISRVRKKDEENFNGDCVSNILRLPERLCPFRDISNHNLQNNSVSLGDCCIRSVERSIFRDRVPVSSAPLPLLAFILL